VYRPGAKRTDPDALMGYGTTVRVYNPETDAWDVTWVGVLNHTHTLFSARTAGSDIVMDATDENGHPFQWIFSDITADGFRWRAQTSTDARQTWVVEQRMTAVRRPR
jgi:hypothetical protein